MPDAFGVDTSSYPKAALPVQRGPLDIAKDLGGLQQQKQQIESGAITIDKQKLELINHQFGLMNAELSTLVNDPSITKEQAAKRLTTFATTYKFPPQVAQHMIEELNTAKDVPSFAKNAISRGMATQEKVNNLYGTPGFINNGQTNTPTITSPMVAGGSPRATGLPIQLQIPPNQPVIGPDNRETLQGPTPAVTPPGTAAGPVPLFPVARPRGDTGTTINQTPNQVVQNRYPGPSGPTTGMPPLFEEGKKLLTDDQANAGARMMRAKPAIQALPLMQTPGFLAGPLTDQFTNAVATLKSTGLIDTAIENDPTAIRQEVVKKLAQYVSGNPVGQRSDAAQTLAEASTPNPKTQILPALIKLTKDAVILDRVEAARPNAFKDKDYSKYGQHRATFPQSIDEKAFGLDLEPEEKSKKLVDDMAKKLQSTNKRDAAQADKFFKSLRIAKEQGYYQ